MKKGNGEQGLGNGEQGTGKREQSPVPNPQSPVPSPQSPIPSPQSPVPSPCSLYVHVPFCAGACDYCDFYSVPVIKNDTRPPRFVDAALSECGRLFETYKPGQVPTLYIGGGTPSVLGADGIRRLLRGLLELVSRYSTPPVEVTVEANPESADEAFLAAAREGGATRLSLGLQTFHGPSRRAVHRVGSDEGGETPQRRLALAGEYFPGAFSADLISGLPFQDERILLDDIKTLLAYRPAHVSLYALTLEERNIPFLPPPDEADRLWLCGRDALEKAGYGQYEVSNFCLGGKESLHNIRYWLMQNWLALGPAASGTIVDDESGNGFRYTIPADVETWLDGSQSKAPLLADTLDTPTLIKESFLMGFRYIEGPDAALFRRRFRRDIGDYIPRTIGIWRDRGLLRQDKAALTREGLLFLDTFLVDAFREMDLSA